jgi:hypothetical protein
MGSPEEENKSPKMLIPWGKTTPKTHNRQAPTMTKRMRTVGLMFNPLSDIWPPVVGSLVRAEDGGA